MCSWPPRQSRTVPHGTAHDGTDDDENTMVITTGLASAEHPAPAVQASAATDH